MPGGRLAATVRIPLAGASPEIGVSSDGSAAGGGTMQATLACTRTRSNDEAAKPALWEQTAEIPAKAISLAGDSVLVPVDFALPADAPPTRDGSPQTTWTLKLNGRLFRRKWKAAFDVPVFWAGPQEIVRPTTLSNQPCP